MQIVMEHGEARDDVPVVLGNHAEEDFAVVLVLGVEKGRAEPPIGPVPGVEESVQEIMVSLRLDVGGVNHGCDGICLEVFPVVARVPVSVEIDCGEEVGASIQGMVSSGIHGVMQDWCEPIEERIAACIVEGWLSVGGDRLEQEESCDAEDVQPSKEDAQGTSAKPIMDTGVEVAEETPGAHN